MKKNEERSVVSIDTIIDKKMYISPRVAHEHIAMEHGIAAGSVEPTQQWDTDSEDKTINW
ncbi:hypothetical protein [Sphingobacterium multivorum]|uniref:hypothetical protein n=1 Tax=Sphingobacterium multivorum TaxID=28454 RepID=UPI0031BB7A06